MKKLLKVTVVIVVLAMSLGVLFACGDKEPTEATINIVTPDGAPALAMAELMKGFEYKDYTVNFEIVSGAADIATKVTQGDADVAILPTNLASVLYNNGVDIKLISANAFGLLYIVGNADADATSLADLNGETIYCIGQGGTPDYVLQYLLQENNIDAEIIYKKDGSEVIPLLKKKIAKYAVLGEPAATNSVAKANAKILFDMQEEWENLTTYNGYPQASAIARGEIIEKYPSFIKSLFSAMQTNIEYINDSENLEEINSTLKQYQSVAAFPSVDVIKKCYLKVVSAENAKDSIENYLTVLKDFNEKTVGGQLPDNDFYYTIK